MCECVRELVDLVERVDMFKLLSDRECVLYLVKLMRKDPALALYVIMLLAYLYVFHLRHTISKSFQSDL